MKLSLIVPCYNEENNVIPFYDAVCETFSGCGFDWETIFINDGSTDSTYQNLMEMYKNASQNVKIICFSRNFGKEAAIYAGLKSAIGEYTAVIDADLQQDPMIVMEMISVLDSDQNVDSVCAYQKTRREGHVLKFFKNTFYRMINRMSDIEFVNGASDFRCFRESVRTAVLGMTEYHRFSKGIFSWIGFNTKYMPYEASERFSGKSSWSFFKLLRYAIEGIIAFTTLPLKISSWIGGISSFASLVYLIVVIIQKLAFGIAVPGYATIVVLILFLGGTQLLSLGIIGEYLSKTYMQVKERPLYIIKDEYNKSK